MPRRATNNSEESPVPRRTSARIAAVQAASPAKSPVKSPRRKRQSTEVNKTTSEDTESQQSHVKSECSIEELNGLETSSSTKDRDSVVDLQELPPKKAKVDDQQPSEECTELPQVAAEVTQMPAEPAPVDETPVPTTTEAIDFEVVEKTDVPPADSAEVKAAISVQGEDGQLLVGFVQVDKDELPSATSLEVKHVTPEQPEDHTTKDAATIHVPTVNPVNGDSEHTDPALAPKTDIHSADNAEAGQVPSLQGEDNQLKFVHTEKHQSVAHLEVANVTPSEPHEDCTVQHKAENAPVNFVPTDHSAPTHGEHMALSDTILSPVEQGEPELPSKLPTVMEPVIQPSLTPAAGDGTVVDAISSEAIPQ